MLKIPVLIRNKWHARVVLAMLFLATSLFVAITFSPFKSGFADAPNRGVGDVELYRAEVDRIHAGEPYYDVLASELRQRGYPTRSVFNWRLPLPVWGIGLLPDISLARGLLGLLGLTLICLSFKWLADEDNVNEGLLAVLLLSGALLPCVLGDLVVMSELWAGVLIALSAVGFGLERRNLGIAAGIAALFLRELSAPFCLLCVLLALSERRYRELAYWTIGLAAYAVYFALHTWQVLPRMTPSDVAHADGWIRFGGAGFLISTAQMNAYLLLLPQWVTAIYLGCVFAGCTRWYTPGGKLVGLTIAMYAVAFGIAGNDFNQYWGSLMAPLYCVAAARAPWALRKLAITAGLFPAKSPAIALQS